MREVDSVNIREAIQARHSVRQFLDQPIGEAEAEKLQKIIKLCNEESALHFQLVQNDPECFNTFLAHYGKFRNANHYIAVIGHKRIKDLDETAGYFGQRIVLEAQMLGLNTCWVAGTYGKGKCKAEVLDGEKLVCVIAVGYGENDGVPHKSKPMEKLCTVPKADMPAWFKNGMLAAVLAPTALNQQRFRIEMDGDHAVISAQKFPMAKIDMGIVRYNFEAASGHKCLYKNAGI